MARLDPARMPSCEMSRIILHWTAGAHTASANDRDHYHILIEADGNVVYGTHPIDTNASPPREPRASHTRQSNTGSIGVAVCGMKDARESPFSPGPFPITIKQWQVAAEVTAELCSRYSIAVTQRTVLAHGEVQAVLKKPQLGKWDPLVLPWTPTISRQQVMEQFRGSVQQHLTAVITPAVMSAGAFALTPRPLARGAAPEKPISQTWKSDTAILLVHGVGNAKPGDYVEVAKAVQDAAGPDVTIYSLFYDVFNDWLIEKTEANEKLKRLVALVKQKQGDGELHETIAEFAGDVLWPMFASTSRMAVQRAFLLQLKQMVLDGNSKGLRKDQMKVSIVCHSLGCFHTYEMLHRIATERAHTLQPLTDGFRFRSVVFMASPVQLIRTLGQAAGILVPTGLAAVGVDLRNPEESGLGRTERSVERWISVTGDLDPIGGHFLRKKADWAYAAVPGQKSIVVPQILSGTGTDEDNLFTALKTSLSHGNPPTLKNPHSWLDYINDSNVDLRSWIA